MVLNKKIIVTGGAGFVGTNLIKLLLEKTKYQILSIDNYSSGKRNNHIKNSRVKYIKGDTTNISKILNSYLIAPIVSILLRQIFCYHLFL